MKNRLTSAQHSQKIRNNMNNELYGLTKLPYIKNNRLFSATIKKVDRPFSQKNKIRELSDLSNMNNNHKNLLKKIPLNKNIIDMNTPIYKLRGLKNRNNKELEIEQPINYSLYNKNDPILRDLFTGLRKTHNVVKKKNRNSKQSIKSKSNKKTKFKIKYFYIEKKNQIQS